MRPGLGSSYRRLWTASALSNLADGVFQIALPLLALRLTRSPALIAGVALAGRLPWLVFALHAGALADRLDRRRTMINVDIARALLIGGVAVVVAVGHEQLAVLYAVAFALGVGETLFDTAAQSIMPMVVHRSDLSHANSRLYVAEIAMNEFVGPPLGGILAGTAMALAFAGSAACYVLAAAALLTMRGAFRPVRKTTGPAGVGVGRETLRTDIAEGLRYLWGHRLLRILAIMTGVGNLTNMAGFAVLPVYAVRPGPMGLSERGFGLLFTTLAAGILVGSFVAPTLERWLGRSRLLALAVVSGAVTTAAPLLTRPLAVGTVLAVGSVPFMGWNVIVVSLRQRIVPEHLLGRVNASYRLLAWGTLPLGSALGGLLSELFGVRAVFAIAGLGALSMLACLPRISDRAIEAAEATATAEEPSAAPERHAGRP